MSSKKLVAKVVDSDFGPCAFCQRTVNDETVYGKLYSIGDLYCHYFCVLLSCCLVQKGDDEDGLLGFLYPDIIQELERSKKHKCSYCNLGHATLGCGVSQCRKQFHLPCGKEKNAVSLFYGNYKSYCSKHAPRQNVTEEVMTNARNRLRQFNKMIRNKNIVKKEPLEDVENEVVCCICYEAVEGFPAVQTFWPPCCARDAWFHRSCLERMALSAGVHYLKCPLCNDKENFYKAVVLQGYYVPDRDAAWELEQNAFADMYVRPVQCRAKMCGCEMGRAHDEPGDWDIKLCLLCGTSGFHQACLPDLGRRHYICEDCQPAAPEDLDQFETMISDVILQEEAQAESSANIRRPIMPSRMSIRRTKPLDKIILYPSLPSIKKEPAFTSSDTKEISRLSRQDLNLSSPKRLTETDSNFKDVSNITHSIISPVKYIESLLKEDDREKFENKIDNLRVHFKQPRPLCYKKKLIITFLNEIEKETSAIRPSMKIWISPKKTDCLLQEKSPKKTTEQYSNTTPKKHMKSKELNISDDSSSTFEMSPEFIATHDSDSDDVLETPKKSKEIQDLSVNTLENDASCIDLISVEGSGPDTPDGSMDNKFISVTPLHKLQNKHTIDDSESFKKTYLNEIDSKLNCNFNHKHENINKMQKSLTSAIDFAVKAATKKCVKSKNKRKDLKKNNKRKRKEKKRKYGNSIRIVFNDKDSENIDKSVNVTLKTDERKKSKKSVSIKEKGMKLKIKWKTENKVKKPKIKKSQIKSPDNTLKQTLLNFSPESVARNNVFVSQMTPKKKLKIKQEKGTDSLKQTSLHTFFKVQDDK